MNIKKLKENLIIPINEMRERETIEMCREITRKQAVFQREYRTDFWEYLSAVFRYEGGMILGLHTLALSVICLEITSITCVFEMIPILIPLFVLAVIPVFFRSQFYGMCEIEAVTRSSTAQITVAKLILTGAASLICMTIVLCITVYTTGSGRELVQIILYALVPYLICMVLMLRCLRIKKRQGAVTVAAAVAFSCLCWGAAARGMPWLYETSATGVWITGFVLFGAFFIREICFVVDTWKEGKIYGVVD